MLDVCEGVFAVKRLRPEFRDRIPQALAYCEGVYQARVPFDRAFTLDDDALYCVEMVEKAYESAGLALSDPVPLCCLPNYACHRSLAFLLQKTTGLRVEEPTYVPGNARYGLYASPLLETVYESPEAANPKWSHHKPPRCAPAHSG